MAGSNQGPWQLKRVKSSTGPFNGTAMNAAIRSAVSVPGQTKILWKYGGTKALSPDKLDVSSVTYNPDFDTMPKQSIRNQGYSVAPTPAPIVPTNNEGWHYKIGYRSLE